MMRSASLRLILLRLTVMGPATSEAKTMFMPYWIPNPCSTSRISVLRTLRDFTMTVSEMGRSTTGGGTIGADATSGVGNAGVTREPAEGAVCPTEAPFEEVWPAEELAPA